MTQRFLIVIGCLVLAAWSLCGNTANATCTEAQVKSLHEKHMSIAKIADRCEMSKDEVQEIIDDAAEVGDDDQPPAAAATPPQRTPMCCDSVGNSRCPIVAGGTALGSQCFCPGQGYGFICR